jgi:hypothetical protein
MHLIASYDPDLYLDIAHVLYNNPPPNDPVWNNGRNFNQPIDILSNLKNITHLRLGEHIYKPLDVLENLKKLIHLESGYIKHFAQPVNMSKIMSLEYLTSEQLYALNYVVPDEIFSQSLEMKYKKKMKFIVSVLLHLQ